MSNPQISVVMPVYNREQYLEESIESILNQTFTDFEFIIVDDQSTDSSWQIIQQYAAKDSRIVAVKNTGKKGCYPARNCGHRLAKGKYIAVMDSDDIALPERLQTQFDFMEQHPDIDICGSWLKSFGTEERVNQTLEKHEEIRDQMFFGCSIPHQTVIYRMTQQKLFYSENYASAQDYELFCRKMNELKFANIPEVLLLYRVHLNQISTASRKEQSDNGDRTRLRNIETIGITLSEKEKQIYLDTLYWKFIPENKLELLLSVKMLNNISVAGKKHGYGKKFQETIKTYIQPMPETAIKNKMASPNLFFIFFRWHTLPTFRSKVRYIYYCLRNLLHV